MQLLSINCLKVAAMLPEKKITLVENSSKKERDSKMYKITRLQNGELGQKTYLQKVSHSKSMQTSSEL